MIVFRKANVFLRQALSFKQRNTACNPVLSQQLSNHSVNNKFSRARLVYLSNCNGKVCLFSYSNNQFSDSYNRVLKKCSYIMKILFALAISWRCYAIKPATCQMRDDEFSKFDDVKHENEFKDEEFNELSSAFLPFVADELKLTDPIEISDAEKLSYSHLLKEAAGVTTESALMLTMRACRALLSALRAYRESLLDMIQVLNYQKNIISASAQGILNESMLQEITMHQTAVNATLNNRKQRVTDLQLLVRVSSQALELLSLCCHLTRSEVTAVSTASAVDSLRSKVEAAESEVRSLNAEVLRIKANIIALDKEATKDNDDEHHEEEIK